MCMNHYCDNALKFVSFNYVQCRKGLKATTVHIPHQSIDLGTGRIYFLIKILEYTPKKLCYTIPCLHAQKFYGYSVYKFCNNFALNTCKNSVNFFPTL